MKNWKKRCIELGKTNADLLARMKSDRKKAIQEEKRLLLLFK